MATSKSLVHTEGWYTHHLDVWVISQDVEENKSRIGYRYWVHHERSTNGAWTTLNNCEFTVTIEGQTDTSSPNFDFRNNNQNITMMRGEFTVTHGSEGALDVDLYFANETLPGGSFFDASSQSGTFAPTVIPRASTFTVTPNPVIEGDTVTIDITRASGSFTHTITWVSGVDSGTIGTGVATTDTFTPDPGLLGGATRVAITITVETFNGATSLGTTSADLILRATPVYPEVGVGTPYDIRIRRTELDGTDWVVKEAIPFIDASVTDTLSASGTINLTVAGDIYETSLDEEVVVVDFFDGSQWLNENMVFVLNRVENDKVDVTNAVKYTGQSFVEYLLTKAQVPEDDDWDDDDWTVGRILYQYIDEAKDRGWGPYVEANFTQTATSIATPYRHTTTLNATKNTPLSQLLDGFVSDILVEYRTYYDVTDGKAYLDLYNPGYGSDWTVRGADPIINLSTTALNKVVDKAPIRKDFSEKLTRVSVAGDEVNVTRESATNVNPLFGHLEGSVSATGIKNLARLNELGDAALANNATATVERTFTYDLSSTQTPTALFPYRTFRPGDWILVPGDNGPERNRVSQVSISRGLDSVTATITVGDLIPGGLAATARKLTQAGGGAIPGGTLRTPLGLSSAIPAAPEGLTEVLAGYWDEAGQPKSGINLTWAAVTESLAGNDITVDLYEVWTRAELGTPWTLATLSDDTEVDLTNLEVNRTLDIQVRGRSLDGIYGAFSEVLTVTTIAPAVDIDGPDIADLYTDGVGNIFIVWGGTLDGVAAPARLAYVVAEVSDDAGATYVQMGTPIVAAGQIVVNPGAWGTFTVRLRGYDRLGNAGDASDPQDITLTDPYITPITPVAPTGLTATAGAGWDAAGINPLAWFDLEWDAVTLDTEGATVDVVGYDVWGKRADEVDLRFLTSVTGTTARWVVEPDEEWSFQVSATSVSGGVSALSDPYTLIADATITAPTAPSAPTLSQYAGILRIQWAGTGMQPYIKYAYAMISTASGGTYTRAGAPLLGPGEVVIPGLTVGVTYYAKIVLVAEDGQTATSPASSGLLLEPITGVTVQTSSVADEGVKLTNGGIFAYNVSGEATFIVDAATGEVTIAAYDAVFELGADGYEAETSDPTTGIAISSEGSSFNTFIHPSGVQIRNDQTPLSWWEADASDASLVNFVSPRARVDQRMRIGDYEFLREEKTTGTRLVVRYKGA